MRGDSTTAPQSIATATVRAYRVRDALIERISAGHVEAPVAAVADWIGASEITARRGLAEVRALGWFRAYYQTVSTPLGVRRLPTLYQVLSGCPGIPPEYRSDHPGEREVLLTSTDHRPPSREGLVERGVAITRVIASRRTTIASATIGEGVMAKEFKGSDPKPVRAEGADLVKGVDGRVKRRRVRVEKPPEGPVQPTYEARKTAAGRRPTLAERQSEIWRMFQ